MFELGENVIIVCVCVFSSLLVCLKLKKKKIKLTNQTQKITTIKTLFFIQFVKINYD